MICDVCGRTVITPMGMYFRWPYTCSYECRAKLHDELKKDMDKREMVNPRNSDPSGGPRR